MWWDEWTWQNVRLNSRWNGCEKGVGVKTNEDQIYGFQDFGELGRENVVVNKVFTMMIRGLNRNWKQSFAYYVGSPNGVTIKKIIQNALKLLTEIGFMV